jgi:glutaredoxin
LVVIYGKVGCSFCDKAKAYLKEQGTEYQYIDIMEDFDSAFEFTKEYGIIKTVPQIVIDNVLIGGYTDLVNIKGA